MRLRDNFIEIFGSFERAAGIAIADVEHAAEDVIHFAEKEITVIPQSFADAIARIKAALSSHTDQSSADAATIASLQSQLATSNQALSDLQATCNAHDATIADLQSQLDACKALDAQKDAAVADLTQQLADATSQIADMEAAILDVAPVPAA